jgi:hypothetical protein
VIRGWGRQEGSFKPEGYSLQGTAGLPYDEEKIVEVHEWPAEPDDESSSPHS